MSVRFRLACLIMLVVLISPGCSSIAANTPEPATPTPIPTPIIPLKPTYTVQVGDVVQTLTLTGRVSPIKEQAMFFKTSGRIRVVMVKRMDTVKAGQLLADLEGATDLERKLEEGKLNVRRAEVQLSVAQNNLALFKYSMQKWMTGYAERLANQEADVELAQIALEEANLGLQDLQDLIDGSQIKAPFDGLITSINMSEGSGIEAYAPMVVVADVSQLEISASLTDKDMQQLKQGMPIKATPFNLLAEPIDGVLRKLPYPYNGGSVDMTDQDQSTRFTLNVTPEEANLALGDLLQITVEIQKRSGVLWLPPQAIRTFEGRRFVIISQDGVQQRVDVKLGLQSDDRVEITEGLQEGQTIIGP